MTAPQDMAGLEAHLDAASGLIGLDIAPAHRPGTLRFLALAAEMAAVVQAAPWDGRHADLAPVYRLPDMHDQTGQTGMPERGQ